MTLTEKEKNELDNLAKKLPIWQKHLKEFRKKHPNMKPQEIMKKAGFTFRMKKGKLVSQYFKSKFLKIIQKELKE